MEFCGTKLLAPLYEPLVSVNGSVSVLLWYLVSQWVGGFFVFLNRSFEI